MKPYDLITVKQLLTDELAAVQELYKETKDPILPNVILYLQRRLSGEIK